MDKDQILSIVANELTQAGADYDSYLSGNREKALDYYLGNPRGDEQEGRSKVISTDVADAIEWIIPQIIEALVKGPIVRFDAMHPEDEDQAELESDYVHAVFMQENDGFLNLYQYVKDALLQKNGVFKIWYDDTPEPVTEHYDGLTEPEIMALEADPEVEITEREESAVITPMGGVMVANITLVRRPLQGRIRVQVIPPEEFRVAAGHHSLGLEDARFCAHVTVKSASDLIEEGYDREIIENASAHAEEDAYRFTSQGEDYYGFDSDDPSQKQIEVSECFIRIDMNGDGVAELWKIVVLGSDSASEILDMEEVDSIPFVSSTAIIMPHKFYGLSIYDRLRQIQDQKTSLWRNILDNLYLQNNREKEVVEGLVNLDDLLVSRPGGIKRVKQAGAIRELQVQPIGSDGYTMLTYLDQVRTGRVGVSPETQGQDLPVGNETAHGVERLMTAKEKLTGLMIRTMAETGLKQAYKRVRDLLIKHKASATAYKFRNRWVQVNPSTWGPRSRISVTVGTGTGEEMRKQAALQQVLAYQEKILTNPEQVLVDQPQIYTALSDLIGVAGLQGAERYFIDPTSQEGQQKAQGKAQQAQQAQAQQQQVQQAMAEAQAQVAQAELMKGQAALQSQQVKLQTDMQKAQYEAQIQQLKMQVEQMRTQIDRVQADAKLQLEYAKLASQEALKLTELEVSANRDLSQQNQQNRESFDAIA